MNFSVALCTYNGAKYLQPQLESIAAQTLLPSEMVACDDGSADDTVRMLQAFAETAPFPVRVVGNEHNLGSTANFEKAIRLCRGDVIALSDQDDVWLPEKLERIATAFAASPRIGVIFSNAEVVDEHLHPSGPRLWVCIGFTTKKQRLMRQGSAFHVLLALNAVTGATMAFRASLRPLVLPIPMGIGLVHDHWIALTAAAVTEIALVEQPLIFYRQHTHQQLGAVGYARTRLLPKSHYQMHIRQIEALLQRLTEYNRLHSVPGLETLCARMESKVDHIRTRLTLPANKLARVPLVLRELITLRYHHFSHGLSSVARDLFC